MTADALLAIADRLAALDVVGSNRMLLDDAVAELRTLAHPEQPQPFYAPVAQPAPRKRPRARR
jgi:hypothetical protein